MGIAFAAAGNDEVPARFQCAGRAVQDGFVIIHPVQRCVGKHEVEFVWEANFPRVGDLKFQIGNFRWWKSFARESDHFRRGVGARHRAARHGVG